MAEKKPATIFDFINGITHQKKEWSEWSETDQKRFSPFIVNRWLSMRQDLTDFVNELQKYTIGLLRPKEVYQLYHDFLPAQKSFAKYVKGKKEDKYSDKLVNQIAEHYDVSTRESLDYIELLTKDHLAEILTMYGYSEKEKKTMLKGIK
jgi:hypothetical protein